MSETKVNLPKTNFPMRGNLPQKEPETINFWNKIELYNKIRAKRSGREKFILHDGPPYANGNIHIGTALNKILKDIVVKFKSIDGKDCPYVPGWDCHGLPIEWKIEEQNKKKGIDKKNISILEFRNQCREFAKEWISIQREQFKRLGVLGDWQNYYATMSNDAEAQIALEILAFLKNGSLYKGYKPVLWSVVEATALADAEVEYQDHVSNQIYVKFDLKSNFKGHNNLNIIIWTTTPWTIPCNRALAYNSNLNYGIYQNESGEKFIIANDLFESFQKVTNENYKLIENFSGNELKDQIANHPFKELGYNFDVPLFEADFVTTEQGTGIVHIAPSHGPDDFALGLKNGIKAENTIDDNGHYTNIIKFFEGTHIFKADKIIIEELQKLKKLIFTAEYKHSYPHSWRSKAPLVHRATPQWFISMEKNELRKKSLDNINSTSFFPAIGKNRIQGMIETRPDWCISRQRFWGVPLPIFINKKTNEPLLDDSVNSRIFQIFKKEGSDAWYEKEPSEFLGEKYKADDYQKVEDIVEVWFDSGSTHAYVLENRDDLNWPADMYLEGSDQHRGWFHSSLLQSVGTRGKAPYKSILTHGFVVDGKGQKMSKSLGNVIAPEEIIKRNGADILRLWVVASDYSEDLRIDQSIITQHSESYRKIRNTLRFLLGNILDNFSFQEVENINFSKIDIIDSFILNKISELDENFGKYLETNDFHKIYVELLNFCTTDLSSFYFDIRKDALYCDDLDSIRRLNCVSVLKVSLYFLIKWLNPILVFTIEEVFQTIKTSECNKNSEFEESVFLIDFKKIDYRGKIDFSSERWETLKKIKNEINLIFEDMRNKKIIKSGLETEINIFLSEKINSIFKNLNLSDFFVCSKVNISQNYNNDNFKSLSTVDDTKVLVKKASGKKCDHCWKISEVSCERKNCPF
ncbi:MAG: isoleucine--tRNA ligase [Pelagibacteraceae bacterium]|nr:isoleucine--tRNA ligase [Pelagibacteraceae bacterium]MCI5079588.1 isoleucine--tRNA ligase [Pelagibacteraceae bacterium]